MKIIIRFWEYVKYYTPDYKKQHTKTFEGDNALDCMAQIASYRHNHDCAKYTPVEIINVEDMTDEDRVLLSSRRY